MNQPMMIDGLLVQWGDRLFYPGNRRVSNEAPRLYVGTTAQRAAALRRHVAAIVKRRVPQVMVKVTGGGRGMGAIAAHFRYISKNGRIELEDDRGEMLKGRDALRGLADDWRRGGALIREEGDRREALNIMLSMPRGTDPMSVLRAAREFAQVEMADHKYVMVLHDHQANPHVHLSVRVESRHGLRLNPRKTDLHRWRELFAEKLRGWGIEAEASSRGTRGTHRGYEPLWRLKAREEGRLRRSNQELDTARSGSRGLVRRRSAWLEISNLLERGDASDQDLSRAIRQFVSLDPMAVERSRGRFDGGRAMVRIR